jgi:hypothetical protein
MYVLIDITNSQVVYRHENNMVLRHLAYLEAGSCATKIFDENNRAAYLSMPDIKLHQLYENLTEQEFKGARDPLVNVLMNLMTTVEVVQADEYKLLLQTLCIKPFDIAHYIYARGVNKPQQIPLPQAMQGRRGDLVKALLRLHTAPQIMAAMPVITNQWGNEPVVTGAKYAPPWL